MESQKNLGVPDRVVRIVIGSILLSTTVLAFVGPQTPWAYWGLIGVLPLFAGILGYCAPYQFLGINTYKGKQSNK